MELRFCSLASGSSGNCYVIQTDTTSVMMDAGISARKIQQGLENLKAGETPQALLLTHEHDDHVKGMTTLAKRFPQMMVYATEGTWGNLSQSAAPEQVQVLTDGQTLTIGDLQIQTFAVSHDAAAPVGYSLRHGEKQITIVTDTGYCSDEILAQAEQADLLVLEANHDVDMLRIGGYPWFLKQRILGDRGHLSNETAGRCLVELLRRNEKKRQVFLAHLSRKNNFPEMAYQTVKNILEDANYYIGNQVRLEILRRDCMSGICEL